ncbi:MAG: hypothetical protein K6G61_01900 [Solobacterium sp.]|nr:hypothetical protein [Solobacterium sp.]
MIFSIFYIWYGSPLFVFAMAAAAVFSYVSGAMISRYRKKNRPQALRLLRITAGIYLVLLFVMKFLGPILTGLRSMGLSFLPDHFIQVPPGFTFLILACISYPADICFNRCDPERSAAQLLGWILHFPKLLCGPFVAKKEFTPGKDSRGVNIYSGLLRFAAGLFKKTVIAAKAYTLFMTVSTLQAGSSVLSAWTGAFAALTALYFELSGYADMAIGLSRMAGYVLPEEFRMPLASRDMKEFTERWSVTLQNWFRTYVPFGNTSVRTVTAILLTGLFYRPSLNGLAWGIILACTALLSKLIPERIPAVKRILLWAALLFSSVFILSPSFADALHYTAMMFFNASSFADALTGSLVFMNLIPAAALCAAVIPVLRPLFRRILNSDAAWIIPPAVILLFVFAVAAAVSGASMPFIFLRSL